MCFVNSNLKPPLSCLILGNRTAPFATRKKQPGIKVFPFAAKLAAGALPPAPRASMLSHSPPTPKVSALLNLLCRTRRKFCLPQPASNKTKLIWTVTEAECRSCFGGLSSVQRKPLSGGVTESRRQTTTDVATVSSVCKYDIG